MSPSSVDNSRIKYTKWEDVGFATLWDAHDEPQVDKMLHKIRNHEVPAETLEHKLGRFFNDQTTDIEPLEMTEPKLDLVVNAGLVRIAQLVTGKTNATFNSYASGTGTSSERASDVRLSNENWRVSIIASGYMEPVGTTMKFAAKFPVTVPTATITEGGVFDTGSANAGTMLFRTRYPTTSFVQHIQSRTFYSLLQSINQVAIT